VKCKTGTNVNVKCFIVHVMQVRRRKRMAFIVLTCMGKEDCILQNLSVKG